LSGPIAAGTWHLIGDVDVLASCDLRYDFIWRAGGTDTTLVSFTQHFEPPGGYQATRYDADGDGIAAASAAGDQLVWRYTVLPSADGAAVGTTAIIPNGDGTSTGGRFPSITLPPNASD
jgi:hypothetical protein